MALQSLTQSVFDNDATCGYCFGGSLVVVVGSDVNYTSI
jgi:hypothetical protein